jgi:tetratricopeptide (TPR) repeat protein
MKKFALLLMVLPFLAWSETSTLVSVGPKPKNMDDGSYQLLMSQCIYNLNDLNDILNNVYLPVPTAIDWANSVIAEINRTNTNLISVKGKIVQPTKIAPLKPAAFSPTFFKSLSNYIRFQQALDIQFSLQGTTYTVNFSLYPNLTATKPTVQTVSIPASSLTNRSLLNTLFKESIITLFNQWDRYYYQPEVTGKMTLSIVPASANNIEIISLPSVIIRPGQNTLPLGSYPVLIRADGYDPFFTNISVGFTPTQYTIRLVATRTVVGSAESIPTGHLFLNADYPGAQFLILENGVQGRTPFFITNLPAGSKTVVFEETENYRMKQVSFNLAPNVLNIQNVSLSRKGTSFVISSPDEGASVIINRRKVGTIQNGAFEAQVVPGLNLITVIKDGYVAFRTNIIFKDEQKKLTVKLTPKSVVGYLISTPEKNLTVTVEKKRYKTPAIVAFSETPYLALEFHGTNAGYMNVVTNVEWSSSRFNVVLAQLSPIFGDLSLTTQPDDAYVSVNNIPRGKTVAGGLKLTMLPARELTIRIEKEGYKTLTTNFFIQPNMENILFLKLKDAPAKLYVSTVPEKGFEAYVNDDFVGFTSSNVFSVEMGTITLKLNKRGFKTIVTNMTIDSKDTKLITFTTTPGVGEDDVIDSGMFFFQEALDAANQNDFFTTSSNFALALLTLNSSEYKDFPKVQRVVKEILSAKKDLGTPLAVVELAIDVSTNYEALRFQAEKGDLSNSVAGMLSLVARLDGSGLVSHSILSELRSSIRMSYATYVWKTIEGEVMGHVAAGDTAAQNENYEDALKYYNKALSLIENVNAFENDTLSNTYVDIQLKQKNANNKKAEKELAGDAKALIDTITPMIYEADRKAENGQYAEALRIYQQVLAKIDASQFKDYEKVKEQRNRVAKRIESTTQKKKQSDVWWPKMVRNWTGVSINLLYSGIETQAFGFTPEMNHLARGYLGFHVLPLFQLSLGGMYNTTPHNYTPYGLAVGAGIRIPIIAQWSLFSDVQMLWSDFIVFDIAKNDFVDVGTDLKFGWFGLKLAYTMGWQNYFQTYQSGISAGISFWFTEE